MEDPNVKDILDRQKAEVINIEPKESVKIIKNTKGYNYEVKILEINLKRMKEITDEIERIYNLK